MSQDKKGSAAPKTGYESPFDEKTVIRPKPGYTQEPAKAQSADEEELVVFPPRSSLDDKFDERTAVAPKPQPKPVPKPQPQPAKDHEDEITPIRHAMNIERPKTAPKTPPKHVPKPAPPPKEEDDWDIRQEATYSGAGSSITPEMLKQDDRKRLIIRGVAVFAAVVVLIVIVRRFTKHAPETQDAPAETAAATAPSKVESPGRAPSAKSAGPSAGGGSMDELMQQFDQAFFNTQSQIR